MQAPLTWKSAVRALLPASVRGRLLLTFPALYRSALVRYESVLHERGGLDDLEAEVGRVAHVSGDVIECGSFRCGTSAIVALAFERLGSPRTVYACDSYEGFDPDELERERLAGLTTATSQVFRGTSIDYVNRKLMRLGLTRRVVPVPGFFQDTLPGLAGPFALALVDCDLGESVRFCAEQVWPRLSPGGVLLFDDYVCKDFAGVSKAVDHFVASHAPEIAEHGFRRRLYSVRRGTHAETPTAPPSRSVSEPARPTMVR